MDHRLKVFIAALCIVSTEAHAHPIAWDAPQKPFALYGNTYYVGTAGVSAVLITSPQGHILIDGTGSKGAEIVADNIRLLGFKLSDVKYILNSHAHSDHAGGIAALQKLTNAPVLAGHANLATLASGKASRDDPQYGELPDFEPVIRLRGIRNGEVVTVGPLTLTAHATPGHTPGGTSWTWKSCAHGKCENMVFGDSVTPNAATNYRYTDHPDTVASLRQGFATFEAMPCDILVTAHPEANDLFGRLQQQARYESSAFIDPNACRDLVTYYRARLDKRLATEKR
ncbi:subclass B3 metallo-beta-lactamase [Massilia sp. S19_KUP03_FR1]|uniref:subclass B3 metallo-beta-lactamase n=1 Tax=Massilia sp. S19_KUP03_FR1 TaxID=3025503 RepID=UPI002FCD7753